LVAVRSGVYDQQRRIAKPPFAMVRPRAIVVCISREPQGSSQWILGSAPTYPVTVPLNRITVRVIEVPAAASEPF
jgi:hypothetical protein